jgi:hypothetical protein
MIIEAKMTRQNLGQKEVANELIVDVARYAKFPNVDNLVCLIDVLHDDAPIRLHFRMTWPTAKAGYA